MRFVAAWIVASSTLASVALGQAPAAAPGAAVPPAPGVAAPDQQDAVPASVPSSDAEAAPADLEGERLKIWMSPEMVEARQWIMEYARRSRQFTPRDAQKYLATLRQMSPEEMQKWLQRYAARRASTARSEAVARAARQVAVDEAIRRLHAVQESYDNFNLGQTQGALAAREQYQNQQRNAQQLAASKAAARDAQVQQTLASDYSWIVFPPLYTQVRASASLPGDLPRDDPRNFIRGDVPGPEVAAGLAAAGASPTAITGAPGPVAGAGGGAAPAGGGGTGP
jgi:hypothetical protein